MDLVLLRQPTTDGATLGRLFVDGRPECFTLEDAVHGGPKVPGATAIPAGRYRIRLTLSARFGRVLPLLLDVPEFDGVRIHPGNTIADTAGCVLVGLGLAGFGITQSRLALEALQPKIADAIARGEDVWIDIRAAADVPQFA